MAKQKQSTEAMLNVGVEFGGVSIGKDTARLGVTLSRQHISITAADKTFVGHRLTGMVVLGHDTDAEGQMKLLEDMDHVVSGSFDCKRIGVSAADISVGLTFSLADVDISELAKFSKGRGRLIVSDVGDIPEGEDDTDESEEE